MPPSIHNSTFNLFFHHLIFSVPNSKSNVKIFIETKCHLIFKGTFFVVNVQIEIETNFLYEKSDASFHS